MVYKPLDLSFLAARVSPERESIRNTAAMIMANAGWSKPSQVTMREIAAYNKKIKQQQDSMHKQTALSSLFDLLSTPLYGVANAMDEALAGHQSDSDDSVLEDVAKTVGGVFTGLPKGIGSGLRGASGLLDVLPGVDIDDEWQSKPTDKTHLSDVMIRKTTGMSTADALKPENLEKVKKLIQESKDKPFYEKSPGQIFLEPFTPDFDDPEFQKKYARNTMLGSLPFDIALDPLNAVNLPLRGASASKDIVEGLDAARASNSLVDPIKLGLNSKASKELTPKGALDLPAPVGAVDEPIPAGQGFSPINLSPEAEKPFKTLANVGQRENPKVAGSSLTPRQQKSAAQEIGKLAATGDKNWVYRAAEHLETIDGSVAWDNTFEFLDSANRAVKASGGRHNPQKMIPILLQKMRDDIEATGVAKTAAAPPQIERRFGNKIDQSIPQLGVRDGEIVRGSGPRLKYAEARIANRVIRKFEAEVLATKKAPGTGEGLARAISQGRNVRYSGPQQARMWNQITSNLKYSNDAKYDKAVRILRSVEDYFISKKMIPHSSAKTAESVPLRLSDVAEAIGPQVLGKSHAFITGILRGDPKALAQLTPEQIEALQAVRAKSATEIAPAVQQGLTEAKASADLIAKAPLSVARRNELVKGETLNLGRFVTEQGGGEAGAHVVKQYMGNLLGRNDPINRTLLSNRLQTEAWLGKVGKAPKLGPVNDPKFVQSVTKAISRAADLPNPAQLGGVWGNAAKVKEWLGARFNAAYGVQDMRPIFLRENSSAMSTIGRRAQLINNLARRFDPKNVDLWHEAFVAAQKNGVASGEVAQLQSEIARAMENLFGGTGLRSGAISDSTVIGRNRLLLDELNANLRRFGLGEYQFIASKYKDATGNVHDFSNGLDWMKSWEIWDVKKPYEFLHRVQNAVEHTVREKNMFDEIVSRFASPKKHGDVKFGVNHPRLKGYYFNAEGAKQAKVFVRMLEELSTPSSKSLQYFDHVLSKLKASLTIYIPGHHMTNMIGDLYYNWLAGVNKPIRYDQAVKVMLAQKGRYGDFASFEKLTGPEALQQAMARSLIKPDAGLQIPAAGNKVIITMQDGTKVTADMIYTAMMREGVLPSARVLEEVGSDVSSVLDKFRPLGGRGQRGVHVVSEIRDHIPRVAQFIDGLAKSKGSFPAAAEASARSVRKWHPDGLDLTKFERTVMKRVFPFYSWTRKAIPLAIESAIFAAPKVMAYPRLMEAIALTNGIDPTQRGRDQFPSDQMFPDWLRDRGIGPIMGGPGDYKVINPSTPVLDIFTLLGHPGQSAIDMLNPMVKVPIEVGQDQTLGRNVPIDDYSDYAAKQIPGVSHVGRATGQFGVSDSTRDEGFPNWTNIRNLLLGLKEVNTGKYQKSAQFDLRDYLKKKAEQQGR
jgi:hypothetical protein